MTIYSDFISKSGPEQYGNSGVRSLTHTGGVGLPEDGYSLPLAGPTVGDEGLAVAVFMYRTLTHVCYT